MNKRIIITDSASDLPELEEKLGDIRVLPFKVAFGEETYLSRKDLSRQEFYEKLEAADKLPTTSQITPFEFEQLYTELFEQGYEEAILVLINAKGSATFSNAGQAVESFYEECPEARGKLTIHTVDGRSYTSAYGFPVSQAAQMLKEGVSTEEILLYLRDYMDRSIIYAGLYTLKYAGKSGRIPSAAAFVGDALGMKPIMRICDGGITTGDKVRGEKKIIPFIVDKVKSEMEEGCPYCVLYGSDEALGDEIAALATEKIGYPPAARYQIGEAIAINAGPRVVGLSTLRKK